MLTMQISKVYNSVSSKPAFSKKLSKDSPRTHTHETSSVLAIEFNEEQTKGCKNFLFFYIMGKRYISLFFYSRTPREFCLKLPPAKPSEKSVTNKNIQCSPSCGDQAWKISASYEKIESKALEWKPLSAAFAADPTPKKMEYYKPMKSCTKGNLSNTNSRVPASRILKPRGIKL